MLREYLVAFFDFDGYLAMECSNRTCRKDFCALCFKKWDNSKLAHDCARKCNMNKDVFLDKETWKKKMKAIKQLKVERRLAQQLRSSGLK